MKEFPFDFEVFSNNDLFLSFPDFNDFFASEVPFNFFILSSSELNSFIPNIINP